MSDLISRQAAIDAVFGRSHNIIKQRLKNLPSAQLEIVRCEDCKYYEADITANPWGVCCHKNWIVNDVGQDVDEHGWCYRAERRPQ